MKRISLLLLIAVFTFTLTGCAKRPTNPQDPYESFNRVVYGFNNVVDHLIYRPVAYTYKAVVPSPFRKLVTNFFHNVGELTTLPNDILQGKIHYASVDIARMLVNSTIGIGGLFDVASHIGLPKHYNDFGLTLAYYSDSKQSPYLMIPLLGPSTFRDGVSLVGDAFTQPWPYFKSNWITYGVWAVKFVNLRAQLIDTDKLVDTSFDPYALIRSAYLQHRNQQIDNNENDLAPTFGPKAKTSDQVSDADTPSILPLNVSPEGEALPKTRIQLEDQRTNPNTQEQKKMPNVQERDNQEGLGDANELMSFLKNEPNSFAKQNYAAMHSPTVH